MPDDLKKRHTLTDDQVRILSKEYGTPLYVYEETKLKKAAAKALAFPNAFGLTVRYAMKALPNRIVLGIFHDLGLHMDASSGFEAERAMLAGIPADHIQLTAQELPGNLEKLVQAGVLFNACSLFQLETYGRLFPGSNLSVRINPGLGSGHSNRTNVGGTASSFGIWIDYLDKVKQIAAEHGLIIDRFHTHIGSGTDPEVWEKVARMSLDAAGSLDSVTRLNLGGGFKVGRMPSEVSTQLDECGLAVMEQFKAFHAKTGRKIHLEIEPGTYLVALAGHVITRVHDRVNTGPKGYCFLKTDTGMTENLRPSMYGALHPLRHVALQVAKETSRENVLIVGHCCESGDILTPKAGDPEGLSPVELSKAVIGDYLVIGGVGAYCSGMSAKNYNSFPEAPEVLLKEDGRLMCIRHRQSLEQMLENESQP